MNHLYELGVIYLFSVYRIMLQFPLAYKSVLQPWKRSNPTAPPPINLVQSIKPSYNTVGKTSQNNTVIILGSFLSISLSSL